MCGFLRRPDAEVHRCAHARGRARCRWCGPEPLSLGDELNELHQAHERSHCRSQRVEKQLLTPSSLPQERVRGPAVRGTADGARGKDDRPVLRARRTLPGELATGVDGRVWFTYGHGVGAMAPDGHVTLYRLAGVDPNGLAIGPDGAVWVTDVVSGGVVAAVRIGRGDDLVSSVGLRPARRGCRGRCLPHRRGWRSDLSGLSRRRGAARRSVARSPTRTDSTRHMVA